MTQTGPKSKPVVSVLDIQNDPWVKMETAGLGIASRLAKFISRIALEFTSVVMTLAIIWLGALGVLMSRQSVDLKFFKPHYEHWFSGAFSGKSADIKTYTAHWIQEKRAIEIRASQIKITGQNGDFQNINEIRGEFTLAPKLLSRPILTALTVDGGALTISRDERGRVQMGLGTPETYEKVGPLWLSKNQIDTSPSAQIDAITSIAVKSADVYFKDQINQLSLTLSSVDGVYENDGEAISIQSNGNIWQEERVSPYQLDVQTNLARNSFDVNAQVKALYPVDIAPKLGAFAVLADIDAPVNLEMRLQVLQGAQLNDLFVKMDVGQGKLKTGKTYKQFESARIDARYDAQSQAINISDFTIASEPITGQFSGQIKNIGTAALGFFHAPVEFEISMKEGRINPGEKYLGPIVLGESKVKGAVDFGENSINIDALNFDLGSYQTDLKVFAKRQSNGNLSALKINGQILGTVSPQQVLSLWPNDIALGGRNWVVKSLQAGEFSNFNIQIDLTEEDLRAKIAADDHINISFDAQKVDIRYLRKMPWLRNSTGYGLFRGNGLEYTLTSGQVDGLELQKGIVSIPQISPKGGDFTVDLFGTGTAKEMLRVSDFEPLNIASRFGIKPEDFGGQGNIHLFIQRPLLENVDPEKLIYDLKGEFSGVSAPVGIGSNRLNDGNVDLHINNQGMEIAGPVKIGKWQGNLDWKKVFNAVPIPAKYTVSGTITRDDMDNLGVGLRRHFGGEIGVVLDGQGTGLDVQTAYLTADFSKAEMNFGDVWSKPLGAPAKMTGRVIFGKQGGGGIEGFEVEAEGVSLKGSINLAQDYRLQYVDISRAYIEGFIDAQIKANSTPEGVLVLDLSGKYLNLSSWVNRAFQTQSSLVSAPIFFTGALEELALSDNYYLENATALYSHNGVSVDQAKLQGQVDMGPFIAELTRKDGIQNRYIHVDIPDASRAMLALLGLNSIEGGALQIDGELPPSGEPGGVSGNLSLTDFTLVRAPAFAQLLSLASLQGLANTLSGDGLKFNQMKMNFSLKDGIIKIREGSASGSALGLTGSGNIDTTGENIDFNGVLVPAYTMNSILGDIPLIGDVMVGKEGEGIFALNYTMKGPIKKIQVNVNPLSALTPGFLRRIFDVKREDIQGKNGKDLTVDQKQEDQKPGN